VIPAEFDYQAPETLEQAISLVVEGGEEAKLLAGGHSLIPLMKLRLAAPTLLVDMRKIAGLRGVASENGGFRIGAMTPHAQLGSTSEVGLAAKAASTIADPQVRHRGTIGGSLAHGDPASDLPAVLLAAEGSVTAKGPQGQRQITAEELFVDYLTTSLAHGEVITDVHLPAQAEFGFGFQKFNRRSEDWAMVGVCALAKTQDGAFTDVRIALTNMSALPVRAQSLEKALIGQPVSEAAIAAAASEAAEGTDPPEDLNASSEYKKHLARVLSRRALEEAAGIAR
jgi:aerobic carbon-monoxide dehydrogenase medium subunit